MLNTLVRTANTLTLAVILQEQSLVRAERLKADARRKERIKMTNEEIIANESYHPCGRRITRITFEELKQAIHKLDLISKPYELYANPSDVAIVKDLIPDNVKLVETSYVEKGKFYLMDRKHFEDALYTIGE